MKRNVSHIPLQKNGVKSVMSCYGCSAWDATAYCTTVVAVRLETIVLDRDKRVEVSEKRNVRVQVLWHSSLALAKMTLYVARCRRQYPWKALSGE